jgi:hypothetical protein
MNDIVSFSVNGELYDIPKSEVDGFMSEFPNAVEVQTFISDKDTFDIPLDEVDGFKSEFPNAKEMVSVKKKRTDRTDSGSTFTWSWRCFGRTYTISFSWSGRT